MNKQPIIKCEDTAELREKIAAIQHDIWAHWVKYLFQVTSRQGGEHIIDYNTARQWDRQILTPYDRLSEREKESDRDQADKVLNVLREYSQ